MVVTDTQRNTAFRLAGFPRGRPVSDDVSFAPYPADAMAMVNFFDDAMMTMLERQAQCGCSDTPAFEHFLAAEILEALATSGLSVDGRDLAAISATVGGTTYGYVGAAEYVENLGRRRRGLLAKARMLPCAPIAPQNGGNDGGGGTGLTIAEIVAGLEALTGTARLDYDSLKDTPDIPAALTIAQIVAGIQALTGAARLGYGSLKDTPTIPTLRTAAETVALLETLTGDARLNADAIRNLPAGGGGGLTIAEIVTGLEALTGAARLDYDSLKDTPTIPAALTTAQTDDFGIVEGMLKGDTFTRTTVSFKSGTTNEILFSTGNTDKYGVPDFFDIDIDDDATELQAVRPGQLFDFKVGSASRVVGVVRGNEENPNDATGRLYWVEILFKRGLNDYDQPATGQTATMTFGMDIDDVAQSVAELRAGLPMGNLVADDALSTDTQLLLKNFTYTDIGQLVEWHDEHHTGKHSIQGFLYNTSNGVTDAGDINVSADKTLVTIRPLNTAMENNIKARIVAGRRVTVRQSDTVYASGICNAGVSKLFGKLSFNFTNDSTLDNAGTFTNNHAITLDFTSNIPARVEFSDVAFTGKAADVTVDASGFDGNLATTDTDVQKVAQKVDDLLVSGGLTFTELTINTSYNSWYDTGYDVETGGVYLVLGRANYSNFANTSMALFHYSQLPTTTTTANLIIWPIGSNVGFRAYLYRNGDNLYANTGAHTYKLDALYIAKII